MNLVQRTLRDLTKKYRTKNPFEIADYLNVHVRYADTNDEFHGIYTPVGGHKLIMLNQKYENTNESHFYMAHELFHAINHSDEVHYYHTGHNVKGKKEREANQFAVYLLLIGKTIYEGQSTFDIMKECYIPENMGEYL